MKDTLGTVGFEMSEAEYNVTLAFFLGEGWQKYGKPFLKKMLEMARDKFSSAKTPEEFFRIQGDVARLRILLEMDELLSSQRKETR